MVVKAFSRFVRHHPDALLLTAWSTPTYLQDGMYDEDILRAFGSAPESTTHADGSVTMHYEPWLASLGVPDPRNNTRHLQLASKTKLAAALRASAVAVFPNRAEGGTNLFAMEAMASRVGALARVVRAAGA